MKTLVSGGISNATLRHCDGVHRWQRIFSLHGKQLHGTYSYKLLLAIQINEVVHLHHF